MAFLGGPGRMAPFLLAVALGMVPPVVAVMVKLQLPVAQWLVQMEGTALALWRTTALTHLIHKKDLGHVADDEYLGPVRNRLGFCTTEVDVHDEDGEGRGSCDHGHSCYVVLT